MGLALGPQLPPLDIQKRDNDDICPHAPGTVMTLVAFGVCGAAEASLCLRIPFMHGMSVLHAACAADSLVSVLSGANG